MTNIPQQSPKCWLHLIGIYIFSIITIYFLEKEFVVYAKYRHNYLRQVITIHNVIPNYTARVNVAHIFEDTCTSPNGFG